MSGRPAGKLDLSGYNYGAISSLVLTADYSALLRRDKEPNGTPTSLVRIDPKEMGSRVKRAVLKDLENQKRAVADAQEGGEKRKRGREGGAGAVRGFGFMDMEELTYQSRMAETRDVYEMMLSAVHTFLGDKAQDVVQMQCRKRSRRSR